MSPVLRALTLAMMTFVLVLPCSGHARSRNHAKKAIHRVKAAAIVKPQPMVLTSPTAVKDAKSVALAFNQWLDLAEHSGQVAGLAAAIIQDDQIMLQRGIGYADSTTQAPVTPDTVFRLASLSKAFATAMAGMLVREGMITWDTRVSGILPTFELKNSEASQQLTVRDILSHRVGLPHNTYDAMLAQETPYPLLVEKLKEVPLHCPVGDCYSYQNVAFSLIGDIIYAVTGDFFYYAVEKRIFHPLGMMTATYGRDALERSPNWARPHARNGNHWKPLEPKEGFYNVPPAAGINASIKDMSQWLMAQMGKHPDVLSEDLLEELHTPLVKTQGELHVSPWRRGRLLNAQYALGWRIYDYAGETLVFHAGAVQGYRAMIGFFPRYHFGMVMLWNCESPMPSGLMPMVLDSYLGLPQTNWAGLEQVNVKIAATGGE